MDNFDQGSKYLTIFNIDTIRPNFRFPLDHGKYGWVEVFEAQGDGWSFVLPQEPGSRWVKQCAEKKRISNYCSTGLYSFVDINQFYRGYQRELNHPSSFELFIAPIYNFLIADNEKIFFYKIDSDKVLLSGIPSEYEALSSTGVNHFFDSKE